MPGEQSARPTRPNRRDEGESRRSLPREREKTIKRCSSNRQLRLGRDDSFEERQEKTAERDAVELVDQATHLVDAPDDHAVVTLEVGAVKVREDEGTREGAEERPQVFVRIWRTTVGGEVQGHVEGTEARFSMEGTSASQVAQA